MRSHPPTTHPPEQQQPIQKGWSKQTLLEAIEHVLDSHLQTAPNPWLSRHQLDQQFKQIYNADLEMLVRHLTQNTRDLKHWLARSGRFASTKPHSPENTTLPNNNVITLTDSKAVAQSQP
jgi:hypothetical protein